MPVVRTGDRVMRATWSPRFQKSHWAQAIHAPIDGIVTRVDAKSDTGRREVKAHDRHWRGGDGQHPLGVLAGDQMVKTAQVELVTAQTVCAGKYIVVVSGEVAAVRFAVAAGVESAASALVDSLIIANVDERVVAAMAGACPTEQVQAVGVMETFSLASSISASRYRRESGGRGG